MNAREPVQTRSWLTVDETFIACQAAGLDRTKKTIRSWARNDHVEAQKQTTPTGDRWMIEEASLSVKIRAELEFQAQNHSPNEDESVRPTDRPVQTSTNGFEPVRTGTDRSEPMQTEQLQEMEAQLRSLEIDKAVRDKQITYLEKQNAERQKSLLAQSRYIGHLETQLLQLGSQPDQRFLEALIPADAEPAHPDQGELHVH